MGPNRTRSSTGLDPIRVYYWAEALGVASQAVPHAILTPLLLSKGVDFSGIALLQAGFSLTILLTEFLSGAVSDLTSRRSMFIASRAVQGVAFLVIFLNDNIALLAFGWSLLGISASLASGSLDAALVNRIKMTASPKEDVTAQISRFVRRTGQISLAAMMVSSAVGAFLYFRVGPLVYVVSVLLSALSAVVVWGLFPREQWGQTKSPGARFGLLASLSAQLRESAGELRSSTSLRRLLVLLLVMQVFFQPHFHLWQAFSLGKGFDEHLFVVLYCGFQALGVLVGFIPTERLRLSENPALLWLSTLGLVLLSLLAFIVDSGWALLPYAAFVSVFWVLLNYASTSLRESVSTSRIGGVIALTSTVSRIGSFATMALVSALAQLAEPSTLVPALFAVAALAAAAVIASERRTCP